MRRGSSTPSLLLNRKAWVWDSPSAEVSSKTITAHFGLNQTRTEELPFSLPFHRAAGVNNEESRASCIREQLAGAKNSDFSNLSQLLTRHIFRHCHLSPFTPKITKSIRALARSLPLPPSPFPLPHFFSSIHFQRNQNHFILTQTKFLLETRPGPNSHVFRHNRFAIVLLCQFKHLLPS